MASPLITRHGLTGVFAPVLFAPVEYYAALASFPAAVIDTSARYDKRFKQAHRYTIADTRGPLTLTVPHSSPGPGRTWDVTPLSDHGRWWDVHRVAWESAYGRTPFFEYYIDRFLPLLKWNEGMTVGGYIRKADALVREILGLETETVYTFPDLSGEGVADLRREDFTPVSPVEYYQVRADRLGFIGGLSVLDLIFNMGTEAPLVLKKIAGNISL